MTTETKTALPSTAPNVHNGTYTVFDEPRKHGHYTMKLWTVRKGKFAGKRMLGLLTGSNNEDDYTAVAFWDDERKRANVFKKWRGQSSRFPTDGYHWQEDGWSVIEKKVEMWVDLVVRGEKGHWWGRQFRYELAGHCVRCNRRLTVPESIEKGIGPMCEGQS